MILSFIGDFLKKDTISVSDKISSTSFLRNEYSKHFENVFVIFRDDLYKQIFRLSTVEMKILIEDKQQWIHESLPAA